MRDEFEDPWHFAVTPSCNVDFNPKWWPKKKGLTNHQQSLVRAYCITETIILLVGGIPSPLKNNFVSWDDETPKWMESHSPFHGSSHHQPVCYWPVTKTRRLREIPIFEDPCVVGTSKDRMLFQMLMQTQQFGSPPSGGSFISSTAMTFSCLAQKCVEIHGISGCLWPKKSW